MSHFLRLLSEEDKANELFRACQNLRAGLVDHRHYEVSPESFDAIPGKPFSYWIPRNLLESYAKYPPTSRELTVRSGSVTFDDFRFLRLSFEINSEHQTTPFSDPWQPISKGGAYSKYYSDPHLLIDWRDSGNYVGECVYLHRPREGFGWGDRGRNRTFFGMPSVTWSRRSQKGFSSRVLPSGMVFSDKSPVVQSADLSRMWHFLAVSNSSAFNRLLETQISFGSYEVGAVERTPLAGMADDATSNAKLLELVLRAWSLKRSLDTTNETSHAFLLPVALRDRIGEFSSVGINAQLVAIEAEVDAIASNLYGYSGDDNLAIAEQGGPEHDIGSEVEDDDEEESSNLQPSSVDALLSWAVGIAFGRFDWRLATGERAAPPEPDPFAPLHSKSPGMLPDGAERFHAHSGILVDDQGHPHDLARQVEEVLVCVGMTVPEDVRRWLQREFFAFHLQRYSKSRRKAPIYWPLATTSGSYTLWVYYPNLTSQTLYTAINDFIEPKLKQVGSNVTALRNKGSARARDDEKHFEVLQVFELELIELRDTLLKLAPAYKPNHDDGVQITASPLWSLFRHKPWQKVLKDTWAKLEKGDYDWAYMAMNYWPERLREKCRTDKSLAIAHGLVHLYIEPKAKPKKAGGRKSAGGDE
jgi:hypothetical protein